MSGATYESILEIAEELSPSPSDERVVRWVTEAGVIGLARAHDGKTEIFLRGEQIAPTSPVVAGAMEYQTWFRSGGLPEIQANRILLPAIGHFDQVSAFICTELVRNGADRELVASFRQTEPIIELALRRLHLAEQALVGLAGELLVLDAMCQTVDDAIVPEVVNRWHGWRESLRDMALGSIGVEVKATTQGASSHQIQGLHQLEPRVDPSGSDSESALFLVSIGLQWASEGDVFSIPVMVDSILTRLDRIDREDLATTFLVHLQEYGAGGGVGYDHRSMSRDPRFARSFVAQFVRGYDMTDPNVKVLRSQDVAMYDHVASGSVTYRVALPATITGSVNPVVGLHNVARTICASA